MTGLWFFPHIFIVVPEKIFLNILNSLSGLRYASFPWKYSKIPFSLWKRKGESEWAAVLQHLLPRQPCPAGPCWQRQPGPSVCPLFPRCLCTIWSWDLLLNGWTQVQALSLESYLSKNTVQCLGNSGGNQVVFPSTNLLTTKPGPRGLVALISCAKTLESLPDKRGNNFYLWELPGNTALYFCSAPLQAKLISVVLWEEETSAAQSLPTPCLIPWLIFPGTEPGSVIPHLQWGQWLETPLQVMLLPQRVEP